MRVCACTGIAAHAPISWSSVSSSCHIESISHYMGLDPRKSVKFYIFQIEKICGSV